MAIGTRHQLPAYAACSRLDWQALRNFAVIGFSDMPSHMAEDIQTLCVVERLFPKIVSGEKTSTIRWRERFISPGPLKFVCDGRPEKTVLVKVRRCTELPLNHAARFIGRADDWPDEVMLDGMRAHYPEIQLASLVQIIEFSIPPTKQRIR